MKTTGNKIIAEFTAKKSRLLSSGKKVLENITLQPDAFYLTMKVVAVGNTAKAEGIDVGDNVYLAISQGQSPYMLSSIDNEESTTETYIFDIYSILGFDKVERDVEPSQA